MGLPSIVIEFKSTGITAIQRGSRGVVALILEDTTELGYHEMVTPDEVPAALSAANKKQVELAMMGSVKAPSKVVAYVIDAATGTLAAALDALQSIKFDYLVYPEIPDVDRVAVATWVKSMRDNVGKKVKAVLPHYEADNEGVINFDTDGIEVGETIYAAKDYCSRIAGMIAGCPLTISATFQPLPEVEAIPRMTKTEVDTAIDEGKLILYNDGEQIKIARAINSLVTTTQDKGTDFQKIKIVDILDLMFMDIKKTSEKSYIGKYANSYDNKCLLISAIQGYFDMLEIDGLLDPKKNTCGINLPSQKAYLKGTGVDVNNMKDQEIKEANTKDKVFLAANVKPLDAIEDINLVVLV